MCLDFDGMTILDYLGYSTREVFSEKAQELLQSINKAMDLVNIEYQRFNSQRNTKLAYKYFMLRYYMHNRIEKFWS
jgi:hypothetical protein